MSPPWAIRVLQPGVAVVQRDPSIESLVELDFGSRKTEAPVLGRDLEAAALPLHDVVVADDAFVQEGADTFQVLRGGAPRFGRFAGYPREAAVIVGHETAKHAVGGVQVAGPREAEFAAQTILEDSPEAFDAAFSLCGLRRDEGHAELLEGAAELGGLAFSGEFFFESPAVVIAHEDGAAVAVESQRDAEATQQAAEQVEVALGRFRGEELSGENFAAGVVLHAQCGEARTAAFEPVVQAAVELDQFALTRDAQATLAVGRGTAFARGADPSAAKQTAKSLAAEGEALDLAQLFAEVVVVEAGVGGAHQTQDALAHRLGQATGAGPAAAGVCQSRLTAAAEALFQTFEMSQAHSHQFGGSGTRQFPLDAGGQHRDAV